jgi:hypothetical protein
VQSLLPIGLGRRPRALFGWWNQDAKGVRQILPQTGPQFHHRRIPKGEGFGHRRLARRSHLASLTRRARQER